MDQHGSFSAIRVLWSFPIRVFLQTEGVRFPEPPTQTQPLKSNKRSDCSVEISERGVELSRGGPLTAKGLQIDTPWRVLVYSLSVPAVLATCSGDRDHVLVAPWHAWPGSFDAPRLARGPRDVSARSLRRLAPSRAGSGSGGAAECWWNSSASRR